MRIEKNSKLLFIGDSITDAGRDHASKGEGRDDTAYGSGYVNLIRGQITALFPNYKIRVVNKGISSNTVRDLKNRWQADVIEQNADCLSIMIGINDVWRQFNRPRIQEDHVCIEEYKNTLEGLIKQNQSTKQIVLMTPYMIEASKQDPMRELMDKYALVVKHLAHKYDCLYIDIQKVFDNYLQHSHSYSIAMDRIHPNIIGHTLIANAWLRALEII